MALLLTEADVSALLPMSLALEAVEETFRWQGQGKLAMEDVAVAVRVMARARAEGRGVEIPV